MQFAQNNPCNALESYLDRKGIFSGDLNRSTLSHRFRSVIRKGQYPREWPRKILTLINEIYEQKKWQVQRLRQWQEFPYCVFYITTGFFSLYFALIKLQWRSTLQYSVFFFWKSRIKPCLSKNDNGLYNYIDTWAFYTLEVQIWSHDISKAGGRARHCLCLCLCLERDQLNIFT